MGFVGNLFTDIPEDLSEELFELILRTEACRIERIVSRGHSSPNDFWYDQDNNEWVLLIKGKACLRFEDKEDPIILSPGSYVQIEKHQKHRVEWTDPNQETIWLAIHYQ